jgi:hypothetical protein
MTLSPIVEVPAGTALPGRLKADLVELPVPRGTKPNLRDHFSDHGSDLDFWHNKINVSVYNARI